MKHSTLLLIMSMSVLPITVKPQPVGLMDWYNLATEFMGTLDHVLEAGAVRVEKYDADGAQVIREFKNNWLSVIGYYKGILPLVTDFYMHYYKNAAFEKKNGHFIQTLRRLIELFTQGGDENAICGQLEKLVGGSLKAGLFQEGVIQTFLSDFDVIVKAKVNCKELIREAKLQGGDIIQFLTFILKGAPRPPPQRSADSEL